MNISKFLAKVIGLYLLIVSIALLTNQQQFTLAINNLINNSALMFVIGFFTIILGILLVVSHNVWEMNWRILITLIGWIALLKGISILIFPQYMDKISLVFIQNPHFAYAAGGVDLLLGLILCYYGFRR